MSILKRVEFTDTGISVTFHLSKEEYALLQPGTTDVLLVPIHNLHRPLVTGRIGNGNRIMVPSKFLKAHGVESLRKIVRSAILTLDKKKLLVIELEQGRTGIPVFEGDENHAFEERVQKT